MLVPISFFAKLVNLRKLHPEGEEKDYYDDESSDEDEEDEEDELKERTCSDAFYKAWKDVEPQLREILHLEAVSTEVVADDHYYNPKYHPDANFFVKKYLELAFIMNDLVTGDLFNYAILVVIIIAGILVGVSSYDEMSNSPVVVALDLVVLIIFILEAAMKMISEGLRPHMYFIGPEWKWNCFDFTIVILSLPVWGTLFGGNSIALLRLVRLSRLGKLIRKIPPLQMIIQGLIGGLTSIGYILLLQFLFYYIYAVMGFYIFGGSDPFHFGSVPISLYSLFRTSTLDNWGDIMFVNIYGCKSYADVYVDDADRTPHNKIFWCENSRRFPLLASVYFISFVVISAFVMLSLFIGTVSMSMMDSMASLQKATEDAKRQEAIEKSKERMLKFGGAKSLSMKAGLPGRRAGFEDKKNVTPYAAVGENEEGLQQNENNNSEEEGNQIAVTKPLFPFIQRCTKFVDSCYTHFDSFTHAYKKKKMRHSLEIAMGADAIDRLDRLENPEKYVNVPPLTWIETYEVYSMKCKSIVDSKIFTSFVTFIICLAGANIGAQTDHRVTQYPYMESLLDTMDVIILSVFTAELVLKMIGEGLTPWMYFDNGWNRFDFVIVVGSYIPGAGSTLTILRLLRLLRVLKLVKRLPQLAVIVNALVMSMTSIGYVGLVLFLFFYVFSILAMILFKENDPWHFGSLHIAFLALFRMITLDNAEVVTYVNVYGCDLYQDIYESYPHLCSTPKATGFLAVVFYLVFVILGAQILLSLFIGVISTSLDQARSIQDKLIKYEKGITEICESMSISLDRVAAFRKVFDTLDFDKSGTVELEEITLGLNSIDAPMTKDEIEYLLVSFDTDNNGLNVIEFMQFMSCTPMWRENARIGKLLAFWKKREDKSKGRRYGEEYEKTLNWNEWLEHKYQRWLLSEADKLLIDQNYAAALIQKVWKKFVRRNPERIKASREKGFSEHARKHGSIGSILRASENREACDKATAATSLGKEIEMTKLAE